MRRILTPNERLPLFGAASTRAIEQRALSSVPRHGLMRRAGAAVARLVLAVAPHARRVWIAAGPGNNGGDGLEAAVHLQATGKEVQISLLADAARMPDDAKDALARAQAAGVSISPGPVSPADGTDVAIDALLGIGLTRPPDGTVAELIRQLNGLRCTTVAVDIPSGLHATTGQPLGSECVRAQHTLALLTLKPGLFTGAGRDHAGAVWLDDLGASTVGTPADAWLTGTANAQPTPREHSQHKGSFGDVAVLGGATGMRGAALLAASAAHAAGAGRVYVDLLEPAGFEHDPRRPELMFRHGWWKGVQTGLARTTVVCGCGGGDAVRQVLPRILAVVPRLVLDADALNAIAADSALQTLLLARSGRGHPTVLTPHPLEAARLLGSSAAHVQADRLRAAQALADKHQCVVLLKGSGTVVTAPSTLPHINPTGNASLATAGTGDVLAGWLGGLWAQQPGSQESAWAAQVACRAAFEHGAAADRSSSAVLRAADLVDLMHQHA